VAKNVVARNVEVLPWKARSLFSPDLDAEVAAVSVADIPDLVGRLEALKTAALLHAVTELVAGVRASDAGKVEAPLTVSETAAALGKSPDWIYEHFKELPFGQRVGRNLSFSREGLRLWLKKKENQNVR